MVTIQPLRTILGRTPLHWAAHNAQEGILQLLLGEYIDPGAKDLYGQTLLLLAAKNGCTGVVNLLVRYGADMNSRYNFEQLSPPWAAGKGHENVVRILLRACNQISETLHKLRFCLQLRKDMPLLWAFSLNTVQTQTRR